MQREHALQVAVARMLGLVLDPARTWWSSIDHAAQLGVKVNRKTGARYSPQGQGRQLRGVKKGLPDVVIMVQPSALPKHAIVGIELKVDKGKLSPEQADTAHSWLMMGQGIYVARSLEEVQEILEHCHVPLRTRMNIFGGGHERARGAAPARHRGARPTRRKPKDRLPVVFRKPSKKI